MAYVRLRSVYWKCKFQYVDVLALWDSVPYLSESLEVKIHAVVVYII